MGGRAKSNEVDERNRNHSCWSCDRSSHVGLLPAFHISVPNIFVLKSPAPSVSYRSLSLLRRPVQAAQCVLRVTT